MKILIVEPDDCGGLLHFTFQLASSLQKAGVDVTVLANHHHELANLEHSFAVDRSLHFWPRVTLPEQRSKGRLMRKLIRSVISMREWLRIIRVIRREKPDYTIFGLIRNPIEAAAILYLNYRGHRLVDVCHEFIRREQNRSLLCFVTRRIMRFAYTKFTCIIFASEKVMIEFRQAVSPNIPTFWVPHGPELIFYNDESERDALFQRYGLREDEPVVLFFGGLRPSKGLDHLVEAFSRVPRGTARLLIAGYPSQEFNLTELHELIERLGIRQDTIVDARYIPMNEVGPLFTLATMVVFPYKSATASGALALAQSQGRAAIATKVGGLSEVIHHGLDGWLVPAGDVEGLRNAICYLLENPEFRNALGAAAQARIQTERSWEVVAERVKKALENNPDIMESKYPYATRTSS